MMLVNEEKCIGCGACVKDCLLNCIKIRDGKAKIRNLICFKCGHCIAVCPKNAVYSDEYDMNEVKEYNKEDFFIDSDNLLNFIKFRRTIRQFDTSKKVEKEKIEKIIEAGRFTPTGSNAQDVSYIVIRNNINTLKELTIETLNDIGKNILHDVTPQYKNYAPYAKMWTKMYADFKENKYDSDKLLFNSNDVIFVVSNSEVNASLASSTMELMANSLGIGVLYSGFLAFAAKNSEKIKDLLGIGNANKVVTCMVLGYPSVKYFRTVPRNNAHITWK